MKTSPQALLEALRKSPRASTSELCQMLGGINRSTLFRLIPQVEEQVIRLGVARRSRYAHRRPLRGQLLNIPLYQLNEKGEGELFAALSLTFPEGSALEAKMPIQWPLDSDMHDGWFDGLPYFVRDMAPAGFLGRNFAISYGKDLQIDTDPSSWSEDDIVIALSTRGADQPGNLILGDKSFDEYLKDKLTVEASLLEEGELFSEYPSRADRAMANGVAGSSAAGEFPKFTAMRWKGGDPISVIVKFSGADNSPAVQRWSDLLICEHHSLQVVQQVLEVPAANSQILQFGGRTFLEVERFDRVGLFGRVPQCSLSCLASALLGEIGDWPKLAYGLALQGSLGREQVDVVRKLWWFGKLIGNSDMHEGNLSFRPGLKLAPIYDMLPMQYAPVRGGEVPPKVYNPPLPFPQEKYAWDAAAHAAEIFWRTAAIDHRISSEFRSICTENISALLKVRGLA